MPTALHPYMSNPTEYLVTLPNGSTRWVTYTPDMLDSTDEDDRPIDAAIRAAKLPLTTRGTISAGKQVKR